MAKRKAKQKPLLIRRAYPGPEVVDHRPPVIISWPPCEADVVTREVIEWRTTNPYARAKVARAEDRGLRPLQCTNVAAYTIDGHWYCRKHAAYLALDMLALEPESN